MALSASPELAYLIKQHPAEVKTLKFVSADSITQF